MASHRVPESLELRPWAAGLDHVSAYLAEDFVQNIDEALNTLQGEEREEVAVIPLIERQRAEINTLCCRFGVHRLEVFGSAATKAFRDDASDLDFLVEFELPTSHGYADRYFGFKEALEVLLGRPVDLVVASAIRNPYFRQSVDETRTLLHAA